MFKKTLTYSELKSDPSVISKMKDKDVFQIIHRGQEVKVMMTQEHFFTQMERLEKAEGTNKTTAYNPDKLMSAIESKLAEMNRVLNKTALKK